MEDFPTELIKHLAAGTASVFVGAGASIAAGLPGWSRLIASLRSDLVDCPKDASFLDVAQFYENSFGRTRLTEEIRKNLDTQSKQPTPLHYALVTLVPKGRIYTTNLDTLLEQAATASNIPFRKTTNIDPPVSFDSDRLNIIKLHGDLEHITSYVISSQDYESYFRKQPGLTRLIGAEFQMGTVLFVGYSHSDVDLRMLLRRVTDENGQFSRTHYTLQVNPDKCVVMDLERRLIRVVRFDCSGTPLSCNQTLARWIEEAINRVRSSAEVSRDPRRGSVSGPNHNFPVPVHGNLIGREKDFNAIFAALATPHTAIVSIEGFSGVGKTALAYEVGLACLSGHGGAPKFDYAVWLSANKTNQRRWFKELLNAIAVTLTGERLGDNWEAYGAERYGLLSGRKVLIVINDYEQIDDVDLERWINDLPENARVLLTTKRSLSRERERCFHIRLTGLESADAIEYVQDRARALGFVSHLQQGDVESLAEVSGGNPQAIKLALGLVQGGTISLAGVVEQLRGIPERWLHENLLEALFDRSWTLLSEDARRLLMMTTLFVGTSIVRLEALSFVSCTEQVDFDRVLGQLLEFRLIEPTYDGRFITHSMTRAFARRKLEDRPEMRAAGERACTRYFLGFVEQRVRRPEPNVPYWNTLVSDRMRNIDSEWSCIQAAIGWAPGADLVSFVMLLAHYMDSRFLNAERIDYVGRALRALLKAGRKQEEALLRIDALSWTLVEADRSQDALGEIGKGLRIAKNLPDGEEKRDLIALGFAWRARVLVELGRVRSATKAVDDALMLPCNDWILHRVHMAAGDVCLKLKHFRDAYRHYLQCKDLVRSYGGEGHDYQIAPRLGFASVGLNRLDEAESFFQSIRYIDKITVGGMYAEYGLALVAQRRGRLNEARELLEHVKSQHTGRADSSLLLKLVNEVFQSLSTAAYGTAGLAGLS